MESKRKASGANGLESANDVDRAAKRRKLLEEYGDLANGESSESTSAYGLSILDSIRATTDKNGRPISPYFETLPSRAEDADYYRKIRLPLSLGIIERKLKEKQYPTLSSLESDFKRLVSNAKETHDRSSTIFTDAERVRKAVSNLMVKHNPAYKSGSYQAVPTPLPPTPKPEDEDNYDEPRPKVDTTEDEAKIESQGDVADDDVEAHEGSGQKANSRREEAGNVDDVDDVDEVDEVDEGEEDGEEEEGEENVDEDEDEADDDKSSEPGRRRSSTWKQASRSSRSSATPAQKLIPRTGKADHYYENVPFKGLSFQQAQEKIVEELIRKKDESEAVVIPYFEAFIYLPPRTLKDYYEIIAEPLSLKALQKQVRGQHGRSEATYVSDFKSWNAFEDQASLIWKNAYHYNEDGSDIFAMAQELEETFQNLLAEARKYVPEPTQPKIKLKLPPAADAPGHPKRITIHVGGKNSVSGSPAPATGQSGEGETARHEAARNEAIRNETPLSKTQLGRAGSTGTSVNLGQGEQARSMSASAGPPSPNMIGATKAEDSTPTALITQPQAATPATVQHIDPMAAHLGPISNGVAPQYQQPPPQITPPPPPPPKRSAADILEALKYRPVPIREAEALMPKLVIVTHPTLQVENKLLTTIPASATEYQQEIVINAPPSQYRLQLKPFIAPFLEREQREWKLNVIHDGMRLYPPSTSADRRGEPVFDVTLRYGINRLEVTLVAAFLRGETAPNGLNAEMERIVVHFNLLRH
ncbi:hypothetical protein GGR50DRAFT_648982 [Xylaria sp. CBS 124048]|nr:hypothetical protein GGR50DRAFT_648982 [Xylaria sp. CBS 124048]